MTSKYKPKDFDEYRKLILPAFQHARELLERRIGGFICPALEHYWDYQNPLPQNDWGRKECARLMKSVMGSHCTLSLWAETVGPANKYHSRTKRGKKLRLDTIDMIIRTIKSWKS